MLLWIIMIGGVGAVLLAFLAMRGPSASKTLKRRVELIRERHGDVIAGNAQAQIRKLMAMTGKDITLAKYLAVCVGVAALVTIALKFRGAPFFLALFVGLFCGIG